MCAASRPKLVGPFSVLMHNPALAGAVNQVVDVVRKDGKLEKRLYELIVLIVVRKWQAAYAWAVHDPLGRAAGLSGDVVDALQAERKPTFAKSDERAIYEAITELLETRRSAMAPTRISSRRSGSTTRSKPSPAPGCIAWSAR